MGEAVNELTSRMTPEELDMYDAEIAKLEKLEEEVENLRMIVAAMESDPDNKIKNV